MIQLLATRYRKCVAWLLFLVFEVSFSPLARAGGGGAPDRAMEMGRTRELPVFDAAPAAGLSPDVAVTGQGGKLLTLRGKSS